MCLTKTNQSIPFTWSAYLLNVNSQQGHTGDLCLLQHWLIIAGAIFYWIGHFEGLSVGPSLIFNSIDFFHRSYQALHFHIDAASLFILARSNLPHSPFRFYSRPKSFSAGRIVTVNTHFSAQQLPEGSGRERNWSAGLQYSKQSLPVPCVLSNYEVQEVAGFASAIKRLKKGLERQMCFQRNTYS